MEENKTQAQGQYFHTAFRGFAKQDVVNYIAELTAKQKRQLEDAALSAQAMEQSIAELQAELAQEKEKSEALRAFAEEAQAQRDSTQQALTQFGLNEQAHIEAANALARRESEDKDACIETLRAQAALSAQLALGAQAEKAFLAQRVDAAEKAAKYYAEKIAALEEENAGLKADLEKAAVIPAPVQKAVLDIKEKIEEVKSEAQTLREDAEKRVQDSKTILTALLSKLKNE